MRTCEIEDCNNKHMGNGYCLKHNKKYKKYGDPLFSKNEKHGMTESSEYQTWLCMKKRCYNKKRKDYKYYGGRGITVCDRWKNSFIAFYKDMGVKPFLKAQIDRKKNNGNYEPGNCKWSTSVENCQNRSNTILNWFTVRSIRRLYTKHKYTYKQLSMIYNIKIRTLKSIVYNQRWKES